LSPRAACRLETLGFAQVVDYVAGKQDWLAHGLPTEGEDADKPTAKDLASDDVATVRMGDSVEGVRERVDDSPYPFAVVISDTEIVLGRVGRSALEANAELRVEEVMEPGPSTVRPDVDLTSLVERLHKRDLHYGIVTTPEGKLMGVLRRSAAEQRLQETATN
jgi:CBS-domain-containing membrane protein